MLLTTTSTIEGRAIQEYKGIVFGEVVAGVDALKDMAAGFTNFFGGRSGSYEEELIGAREEALAELERRSGVSRGKLRGLKRNGFRDLPRSTKGRKHTATKLSGYTGLLDSLLH